MAVGGCPPFINHRHTRKVMVFNMATGVVGFVFMALASFLLSVPLPLLRALTTCLHTHTHTHTHTHRRNRYPPMTSDSIEFLLSIMEGRKETPPEADVSECVSE